ncbi:uncharacterized protein LOC110019532 [Phalaenopsis equestris]|nr:uncharacterized protein LOC110019532 [Phalaenopsis equestris]
MSRPILKEFLRSRTPPKIKMSPTRPDFNSFSFLGGFGQEGKKRYAAFYQPKRIPLLPRSVYRGRDAGGPGARANVLVRFIVGSDILVDCWERPLYSKYAFLGALRSAAQMVPYEVSIGLILIVRLVSTFGSAKAIARMFFRPLFPCGVTGSASEKSTDEPHADAGKLARVGSGRGPRYTVLICVGPCNSSEIVMAQKQIWSGIPLFPVFVMFFISRLAETNRAPSDLPEAEAESVAGYNVEYARDAILNNSLLAEANVPGSRGLILTETRGGSLPTSKSRKKKEGQGTLHSKLMNVGGFCLVLKKGSWVKQTPSLDEHGLSQVESGCAA